MTTQFNLLPDVKLEYIKATYRKRVIITVSIVLSAVFLLIFVLLFLFVRVNQSRHISNLDKDIKTELSTLKSTKDLDKILTIQNQLTSLPALHEQKVFSSRLFDYLAQLTPAQATISNVDTDLEQQTMSIKGSADSLATVNKFVDTLKFTDFKLVGENDTKQGKAFNTVVLASFSVGQATSQVPSSSYEITFKYDPTIFSNTAKEGQATANGVTLVVPKIVTTRSETQRPSSLFESQPKTEEAN